MNWALLQNSLLVSSGTTLLAAAIGFLVALRIATATAAWRRVLLVAALVSLALPPFLVVNTWLDLLGANGLLRRWLPFNLFSLPGTISMLTLMFWPLSAVLTLGAWDRLDAPQVESDPLMRGGALLRWLLWPTARGALGLAAILTFVLSFNQFAIPVILQVPVLPEDLWLALTTRLNDAGAWAAAWPMILMPALMLLALRNSEVAWPRQSGAALSIALARQLGCRWIRSVTIVATLVAILSLLVPLHQLVFAARTWSELPRLLKASPEVVLNSFVFAAITATLCVGLGALAWRNRWMTVFWLMFFVPGVLLGRGLIHGFSETFVYGSVAMVLLAYSLRYLALGWQGARLARQSTDPDLVDAGRMEGQAGWPLFRHFVWSQVERPMAATWYVIYLLALWDVETLVLIYPPGGETLALRVFNLLHYGHNAQVNAMCVALLALALAPLLAWQAWRMIQEL